MYRVLQLVHDHSTSIISISEDKLHRAIDKALSSDCGKDLLRRLEAAENLIEYAGHSEGCNHAINPKYTCRCNFNHYKETYDAIAQQKKENV